MMRPLLLWPLLLLLVRGQSPPICPSPCSCQGAVVDCSHRSLSSSSSLPAIFPPGTKHLRLHGNRLRSLPAAFLDRVAALQSVTLHGNPWVCDCGARPLRAWLLRQPSHGSVACSAPAGLEGRQLAHLTEEELLRSCPPWHCHLASASLAVLLVLVLLQGALLGAVICFLRRFERMSEEVRRSGEDGLTPGGAGGHFLPLKERL